MLIFTSTADSLAAYTETAATDMTTAGLVTRSEVEVCALPAPIAAPSPCDSFRASPVPRGACADVVVHLDETHL